MVSIRDRLLGKKEKSQAELENERVYAEHRAKLEKKYAEEYRASELRAVKSKARRDARQAIFNPAPPAPSGAQKVMRNIKETFGEVQKGISVIGDTARQFTPPETQYGSSRSRDLTPRMDFGIPSYAPKQFTQKSRGKKRGGGSDLWDWSIPSF